VELSVLVPPAAVPAEPAPADGLLAVDVGVERTDPADQRSATLPGGFTYFWPPEITAVVPGRGPTVGGTVVAVRGRFFRQIGAVPFEVDFALAPGTALQITSSTTLTVTTPPGDPGFADVTARNFERSEGTLPDGYFYVAPPVVDAGLLDFHEPQTRLNLAGRQVAVAHH
jgi:hypothetical protein